MSRIPTYEEVVNGMNNAKDPFYGRYPDFSNTLATKTPEFKQLLGESLNQLQEQQIREAKQNQLHELFRNEAQQSGRSFNEINAEHRRPLSISSHLGASHEDNEFFDMDVEDQETKMLQNIETQTEPQPTRKLLYEKIVGESLQPEHMAHSSALSSSSARNAAQEYLQQLYLTGQARRSGEDLAAEAQRRLEHENKELELVRKEKKLQYDKAKQEEAQRNLEAQKAHAEQAILEEVRRLQADKELTRQQAGQLVRSLTQKAQQIEEEHIRAQQRAQEQHQREEEFKREVQRTHVEVQQAIKEVVQEKDHMKRQAEKKVKATTSSTGESPSKKKSKETEKEDESMPQTSSSSSSKGPEVEKIEVPPKSKRSSRRSDDNPEAEHPKPRAKSEAQRGRAVVQEEQAKVRARSRSPIKREGDVDKQLFTKSEWEEKADGFSFAQAAARG